LVPLSVASPLALTEQQAAGEHLTHAAALDHAAVRREPTSGRTSRGDSVERQPVRSIHQPKKLYHTGRNFPNGEGVRASLVTVVSSVMHGDIVGMDVR